MSYAGNFNDGWRDGLGKYFFPNGNIFTGDFHLHVMSKGVMQRVHNQTMTSCYEEYDYVKDIESKKYPL